MSTVNTNTATGTPGFCPISPPVTSDPALQQLGQQLAGLQQQLTNPNNIEYILKQGASGGSSLLPIVGDKINIDVVTSGGTKTVKHLPAFSAYSTVTTLSEITTTTDASSYVVVNLFDATVTADINGHVFSWSESVSPLTLRLQNSSGFLFLNSSGTTVEIDLNIGTPPDGIHNYVLTTFGGTLGWTYGIPDLPGLDGLVYDLSVMNDVLSWTQIYARMPNPPASDTYILGSDTGTLGWVEFPATIDVGNFVLESLDGTIQWTDEDTLVPLDLPTDDGVYELDVSSGDGEWVIDPYPEIPSSDGTYQLNVASTVPTWVSTLVIPASPSSTDGITYVLTIKNGTLAWVAISATACGP